MKTALLSTKYYYIDSKWNDRIYFVVTLNLTTIYRFPVIEVTTIQRCTVTNISVLILHITGSRLSAYTTVIIIVTIVVIDSLYCFRVVLLRGYIENTNWLTFTVFPKPSPLTPLQRCFFTPVRLWLQYSVLFLYCIDLRSIPQCTVMRCAWYGYYTREVLLGLEKPPTRCSATCARLCVFIHTITILSNVGIQSDFLSILTPFFGRKNA